MKVFSVVVSLYLAAFCALNLAAQQPQPATPSVSVAIVLDTSGSMGFKLSRARQFASELLRSASSKDEFAFIVASDRPSVLSGFSSASEAIQPVSFIQPKGRSALIDGMYLGLQVLKIARNDRKVLLIIGDGDDNASRYTEMEVRSALNEAPVRVYTVALGDIDNIPDLFSRISERGGGRNITLAESSGIQEAALHLSSAIRAQP